MSWLGISQTAGTGTGGIARWAKPLRSALRQKPCFDENRERWDGGAEHRAPSTELGMSGGPGKRGAPGAERRMQAGGRRLAAGNSDVSKSVVRGRPRARVRRGRISSAMADSTATGVATSKAKGYALIYADDHPICLMTFWPSSQKRAAGSRRP